MEEEKREELEGERRRKLEEEKRKLEQERQKLQFERINLETKKIEVRESKQPQYEENTYNPQRSTYTYNLRNVIKRSNDGYDFGNFGFNQNTYRPRCPHCRKLKADQFGGGYVNLCAGCGKIKKA